MTITQIRKNYAEIIKPYRAAGLSVAGDVSFLAWLDDEEKSLSKSHEKDCNGELKESGQTRLANRERDTIAAIEAAMPALAGMVIVNGDPRGAALKLSPYIDDETHNTRHGCDAHPKYRELIRELGFTTDWGGFGMLAPTFNK